MASPTAECIVDGRRGAALVCGHLHNGEKRGFHYEADRDAEHIECPDAWCDDCHVLLEEAGEWTDEAFSRCDFQAVCAGCYGRIRAQNWVQDDDAWHDLIDSSVGYLQAQQKVLVADFKLNEHERWDYHQDEAVLTFSNGGKVSVICDIQFVGSFSTVTNTWLWSWANDSIVEQLKDDMRELCEFGEERSFEKLAGACWDAAEEDAWEMTAIAGKYLGAIGAYRGPDETGMTFMIITSARWMQ